MIIAIVIFDVALGFLNGVLAVVAVRNNDPLKASLHGFASGWVLMAALFVATLPA